MKQINNIKFYDMSNGEVKVTYPDGKIDYMLNRDAKIYAYNLVPKEDNNEKNEKKDKEEAIELLRK